MNLRSLISQKLLLDRYTSVFSYSTMRIKTGATLCMRVRRSNQIDPLHENNELDVGFAYVFGKGFVCDTNAIHTFVNAGAVDGQGNGQVSIWYDQNGSENATQTTAGNQPFVVTAGQVELNNGILTVRFDAAGTHFLNCGASLTLGSNKPALAAVAVCKSTKISGTSSIAFNVPGSTSSNPMFTLACAEGSLEFWRTSARRLTSDSPMAAVSIMPHFQEFRVRTAIHAPANNHIELRESAGGIATLTSSGYSNTSSYTQITPARIGRRDNSTALFTGSISELHFFDTLDALPALAYVEADCINRFGV